MTEFASAFLCNPYPEPVEMYIIPSLSQDPNKRFPFLALIQALRDDSKFTSHVLANDSWLLHAVLSLEPPDFGKIDDLFVISTMNKFAGASHVCAVCRIPLTKSADRRD